jgi:hypothetical protein
MNKPVLGAFSFAAGLVLSVSVAARAQATAPSGAQTASLTRVTVAPGPVVVITAAGALPAPTVGVLHAPERIYLDLAGVSTRTLRVQGDGDLVASVRIAQHDLTPLVARVVLDLNRASRYSVNSAARESGRIEIALTPSAAVSTAAAPDKAAPPAMPAVRSKTTNAARERYVARVEQTLGDVSALQSVLRDLDRKTPVPPERLQPAQAELGRLRTTVESLRPPLDLTEAHDLLRSAIGFAASALDLASSSTAGVPDNASSAAAGAVMLFERIQTELQKNPQKKTTDQFVGRQGRW